MRGLPLRVLQRRDEQAILPVRDRASSGWGWMVVIFKLFTFTIICENEDMIQEMTYNISVSFIFYEV